MEDVIINIAGFNVIISACDAERVTTQRWYKCGFKRGPYFSCQMPVPERKNILLHRFIVSCPAGMQVDHINGNVLDNRRSNLRICDHAENMRNRRISKNNTSGYKGVSWEKKKRKWGASIKVNRKTIHLGWFNDLEKAYEAYVAASQKYHGEFGRIV